MEDRPRRAAVKDYRGRCGVPNCKIPPQPYDDYCEFHSAELDRDLKQYEYDRLKIDPEVDHDD